MQKRADLKALLEYLVRGLVKNPEQITINQIEKTDAVLFELKVAPEDRGRLIGKQGKTIQALRKVLSAASSGSGRRVMLELLE